MRRCDGIVGWALVQSDRALEHTGIGSTKQQYLAQNMCTIHICYLLICGPIATRDH